jgi:Aldo/keto reductase family
VGNTRSGHRRAEGGHSRLTCEAVLRTASCQADMRGGGSWSSSVSHVRAPAGIARSPPQCPSTHLHAPGARSRGESSRYRRDLRTYVKEKLVGRAIKGRRDEVVLATKFGFAISPEGSIAGTDSRPEHVGEACDASLARLGVEHIDVFYQHRIDPKVPIEDTIGAMSFGRGRQSALARSLGGVAAHAAPRACSASDYRPAKRVFVVGARRRTRGAANGAGAG